ncbi:MAG: hypothetical protein JSR59_06800 [Proteobacteria bacterium]|nr:hypothetical protein [Pseudomonadota bacterium]
MKRGGSLIVKTVLGVAATMPLASAMAGSVVYRCPGNPVLYTDAISAKEAGDKGCKPLEGAAVTVVQGYRPRDGGGAASSSSGMRVDPADQKARDSDARRILADELKREQDHLAELKAEYKDGQPDRLGNEKNYQKYLDRVADLKASIARSESDIAALQRELAKTGS